MEKYSKLEKIIRITAYVQRFLNNIRSNEKRSGNLSIDELKGAENYWIKTVQFQEYSEEVKCLHKKGPVGSKSPILSLNPYLDKYGILRVGSRLEEASLPYDTRYPIILPKKSSFTDKLIWQSHEEVLHSGLNTTLAQSRRRYWIIQGRQRVTTILGQCLKCKRLKGKAGNECFAPLPRDRLTEATPFKIRGIDFAGPLYVVQDGYQTKVYIMLLTCAVVRAMHLELVPKLNTESCVRGLRRFIAHRGVPEVIYSDNAKTFRRVAQELQRLSSLLESNPVQEFSQKYRIKWRFIVERAAWRDGFWERMVRTVKDALKMTLGKALIEKEELQTILTEVEATVNSRPLTYLNSDSSDLEFLCPSHFLVGPKDTGFSLDLKAPDIKRNEILQQWKRRKNFMAKFWKKWSLEYLQQLRSVHHTPNVKLHSLQKDDIALLYEQHVPRLRWKMVRVTEAYIGRDGRVRACEVQTSDGTKLRRPVQLLFPLEVANSPPREDVKNITSMS